MPYVQCPLCPARKLSKKMLADRPESESELEFFGGPIFLDYDLHLYCERVSGRSKAGQAAIESSERALSNLN